MTTRPLLFLLAIFFLLDTTAQNVPNPYASIGKPAPKIATLTNGAYDEFLLKDSLVLINGDAIRRKTGELVYTEEEQPEIIAQLQEDQKRRYRFLSIDPLARQFPFYTPYQFAGNKPISSIDADGLEDVDYRLIETYEDGSAYVKVGRSDGSTANSHGGNLHIHNLNDGRTYSNFEWNELNTLFDINQNSSYIADRINQGGASGPETYSFRLSDPRDIIRGPTNSDGTKNVVSFSALVSKKSTITPLGSVGGSVSSVADTPENTRDFLLDATKDLINANQKVFGQSAEDVREINISVGVNEYNTINNSDFIRNLQSTYKNASINIVGGESDTGYSIDYEGKEIERAPTPIDED